MRTAFCLLLCTALLASETETWDPHAHPATLMRSISGFTAPRRTMVLAAEYAGRIAAIEVDAGDIITDDSPVIRLDDTLSTLARDEAANQVERLAVALEQQRLAARLAERELAYRTTERERIAGLAAKGQAPDQELDLVSYQLDAATIAREQAAAQTKAAEQDLARGRIALQLAEERLARHQITAPLGWTVVERLAEPDSVVAPQQGVLSLADARSLLVRCMLNEREIRALRGMEMITVHFPQQDDATAAAALLRVSVAFDQVSRKRLVELIIDGNAAPEASGGLEVSFSIPVPDQAGGLQVPQRYVQWISEQPFVHGDDGQRRSLTVLRRQGDDLIVAANSLPVGVRLLPATDDQP